MNIFISTINGGVPRTRRIDPNFTLDDFLNILDDAQATDREHTLSFRYVVRGKPLDICNENAFNSQKSLINEGCNIFVLGRLLGGSKSQQTFQTIIESGLDSELKKVAVHSKECTICFSDEAHCLKVCCMWVCKEDMKNWLRSQLFKISCTVCKKAVLPKDIFQTKEYVATFHALDDEKQLLKNIDCQRCLDCNALICNEGLLASSKCVSCSHKFCFFCCRPWNASKMKNTKYTCGDNCVYEFMITFSLIPFRPNNKIKIPSHRVCPKCFHYGAYDEKCKYHHCTVCKHVFCFLCLESRPNCQSKYKSAYNDACVKIPVKQNYDMFARLLPKTIGKK